MSNKSLPEPVLESCPGCGRQMDITGFEPFSKVQCSCGTKHRVKRTFGNYRLEKRFAIGGMSVIFIARDVILERRVAVKILNEEYGSDPRRVKQFEEEARLTAAVHNPHVVQIYAVGQAYGRFYMVMELLEGTSLEQMMKDRGALPEAEVLEVGKQILDGLNAANEVGVLHRDVKPGNILIDEQGLVKLIDFGLALTTNEGKAVAKEMWATPFYVSPEVLQRRVEDFRSDLYALGASMYHAINGNPPFEATSTKTSFLKERKKAIPRLKKVASWVQDSTGNAIDQMMAYDSRQRPESYRKAIAMVERAQADVALSGASPIHSRSRARQRKWHRAFLLVQGLVLLVALSVAARLVYKMTQAKTEGGQSPVLLEELAELEDLDESPFLSLLPGESEIGKLRERAGEFIGQRDFAEARVLLEEVKGRKKLSEQLRGVLLFEGVLLSLLEGRKEDAAAEAQRVHAEMTGFAVEEPLVMPLAVMIDVLGGRVPAFPGENPVASFEWESPAAAWFARYCWAVKLWEDGQREASLVDFQNLKSSTVPEEYVWLQRYRSLIEGYQFDAVVLAEAEELMGSPNPAAAASRLKKMESQLVTQGEARRVLRQTREVIEARGKE